MAHPGGRPTLYSQEVLDKTEKYIYDARPENQDIVTVEGLALYLGVNKDTLYQWAKDHSEFSDALGKLKMNQKVDLIKTGIFGGKEINATIIALLLKVNHNMIETERKEIVLPSPLLPAQYVSDNDGDSEVVETKEEN